MFFLSFLYYCLKLERYPNIACFEAEYTEQFTPPEIIAAMEAVTAIWLPTSRAYSFLIIRVGVK